MSEYMREGVYSMTGGPNYETDAEVKLLKQNKLKSQLISLTKSENKDPEKYYCQ